MIQVLRAGEGGDFSCDPMAEVSLVDVLSEIDLRASFNPAYSGRRSSPDIKLSSKSRNALNLERLFLGLCTRFSEQSSYACESFHRTFILCSTENMW